MLKGWIPWKYLVKYAARRYGLVDPLRLMARLRRFAQPSEVQEPIELLRAGLVFHARGLVNTRAIQHNLDWIWPYWVEKQFDPCDPSFIPRAFSFTHVNLTHRNWTAVGSPHLPIYPIVDPRGLITPLFDGWSLDAWLVTADGRRLIPSRADSARQEWQLDDHLAVITRCSSEDLVLSSRVWLDPRGDHPRLAWQLDASGPGDLRIAVSLRPYNPEGVQFIETISFEPASNAFLVDKTTRVTFDQYPENVLFANYRQGDVSQRLHLDDRDEAVSCPVGMATAAALFPGGSGRSQSLHVDVDLSQQPDGTVCPTSPSNAGHWNGVLAETARLDIPDQRLRFLYDAAVRTLVLLSSGEVVPGSYTYKRFWFRDACLMLNALLCIGLTDRVFDQIRRFPKRQKSSGYFSSQEGEWDSNGQVLWLCERSLSLSGRSLPGHWQNPLWKGAEWILRKRLDDDSDQPHAGLLPPGFSAEHFGPNDYYYWDDFWAVAGLKAASSLAVRADDPARAERFGREAEALSESIWRSIRQIPQERRLGGIPASPYRRMDAGAVGCLVADYPLQLVDPDDVPTTETARFLVENCLIEDAFFQDMIHSGINPYLTLAIAQTLLRRGDPGFRNLMKRIAALATDTGQWPEAIHPMTGGGCMGDGQHGWAAAEWVMMLRNIFVREERDGLVLGSGLLPEWLDSKSTLRFGPTLTPWGSVTVKVLKCRGETLLGFDADWRREPSSLEARLPGFSPRQVPPDGQLTTLTREAP